jgi:hypothetical protein
MVADCGVGLGGSIPPSPSKLYCYETDGTIPTHSKCEVEKEIPF